MSTYPVDGKVALITGAARGIGYATAEHLIKQGARVTLVDLDPVATAEAAARLGENALGLAGDVTDPAAMTDAVDRTVAHFGQLDIVVANAGIAPRAATARTMQSSTFERVLEVNVLGVYRTVDAALPHIVANGGHVVVVASIYAFINGSLLAPYAMSKAAVEQYGRALRVELASHGASVTVAYFGFIDTDLVRDLIADPVAHRFEETFPSFLRKRLQPAQAGAVIVEGIEHRAARVIAPKRWAAYSRLRGLVNPVLDRRMERDATLQAILRDADVPNYQSTPARKGAIA